MLLPAFIQKHMTTTASTKQRKTRMASLVLEREDTFTVFPCLPPEIRIAIWEASFPFRELQFCYRGLEYKGPPRKQSKFGIKREERIRTRPLLICASDWNTNCPSERYLPIVASYVCRESRRVALKAGYKMWDQDLRPNERMDYPRYWNPAYDTVYFLDVYHEWYKPGLPFSLLWLSTPGCKNRAFIQQIQLAKWFNIPRRLWNKNGVDKEGMVEVWCGDGDLEEMMVVLAHAYKNARCKCTRRGNNATRDEIVLFADDVIRDIPNTTVLPISSRDSDSDESH